MGKQMLKGGGGGGGLTLENYVFHNYLTNNYCTNFQKNRIKTTGEVREELILRSFVVSDNFYSLPGGADTSKLCLAQLWLVGYFRLFIVATGCPSERRPQKTVICYGG